MCCFDFCGARVDGGAGGGGRGLHPPVSARLRFPEGGGRSVRGEHPTVRLRLDRLIQKIKLSDERAADPYVALIKRLAVNDKVDFEAAKLLISEYRKIKEATL